MPIEFIPPISSGQSNWGAISGTIGAQQDLSDLINTKADADHTHNLAALTEKSYQSLTDKPDLSQYAPLNHNHDSLYLKKSGFALPDTGYHLNSTYLTAGIASDLNFGTDSFSICINFSGFTSQLSSSSDIYAVFHKLSSNTGFNLLFRGGGYNGIVFGMGTGTTVYSINPTIDISQILRDGKLHQVIVTRNGSVGAIFLDGTSITVNGTLTASYSDTNAYPVAIGRYAASSAGYITADFHSIIILDHAVSASEAASLWNNGSQTFIPVPQNVKLFLLSAGNYSWADESGNNVHFQDFGSLPLSRNQDIITDKRSITGDTVITAAVQKNYELCQAKIVNTSQNSVTVNLGTYAGGSDVISGKIVAGNSNCFTKINMIFSDAADQNLYISSSNWNSSNLRLTMSLRRFS